MELTGGIMLRRTACGLPTKVAGLGWAAAGRYLEKETLATSSEATRAEVSPVVSGKTAQKVAIATLGCIGAGALYWGLTDGFSKDEEQTTYTNWSSTHEVTPWRCVTPESQKEIEKLVTQCHTTKQKMRVVGSGLSPNGIAFSSETMVDMSLMDKVLHVDAEKKQIRVQPGARVDVVVEALRPYGLTLQNYASIREQQIGGFIQTGAHGTGAAIPPVDEQAVQMKIVTPDMGTVELSKDDEDPTFFYLARVGLGSFGVLTEVTLQCVPEHKLVEHMFVTTHKEVKKNHARWLSENKHLKYLWIPHTESVIVVHCNPLTASNAPKTTTSSYNPLQQTQAMRELIAAKVVDEKVREETLEQIQELSFPELRALALNEAPGDAEWVKKVNKAEEDYWKKSEGFRVGWSDQILGFDCGGQQWVSEVVFPTGTLSKPSFADLEFIQELLQQIQKHNTPAHGPIEQRWTCSSASLLSPVYSNHKDEVHCWVGIILYLPNDDPKVRQELTSSFKDYAGRMESTLLPKYNGAWHWAKLEIDRHDLTFLQQRLKAKLPIEKAETERKKFDSNGILTNRITRAIFRP